MSIFSPVANDFYHRSPTQSQTAIVLCDFDGTISVKDVTDTLLNSFGQEGCDELEALWVAGKIGSKECMSRQIALMDASLSELDRAISKIEIDPTFKSFIHYTEKNNIPVHIVSDGLDYAIQSILKHHNLGHLPVFANRLVHDNDRSWRLEFPYANKHCIKQSGNCKCNHVKKQRHFDQILYVGDGTSDYCVSHNVDFIFAKDKLIHYCQKNNIHHAVIHSFADVTESLKQDQRSVIPTMMME